jgi:hypothetical protein
MIARHGSSTNVSSLNGPRRQYRMMFRANDRGLAKRVEIWAGAVKEAVELALADHSLRTVDIWEDDAFVCRVSREANSRDQDDGNAHVQ